MVAIAHPATNTNKDEKQTQQSSSSSVSSSSNPKIRNLVSDVPRRLFTICVGVPILWCLWSIPWGRHVFFQGTLMVMCWEWGILAKMSQTPRIWFIILAVALANVQDSGLYMIALLFSVAAFPILVSSSTRTDNNISPTTILSSTAGFLLISTPCRAWLDVSKDFHATVSLLLTVWNADTGALVLGRIGALAQTNWPRPQWLRQVSPSKSVEGLLGGLVGGTLTYCTLPWFWSVIDWFHLAPSDVTTTSGHDKLLESLTLEQHLTVGFLLSVAAILGDLWESSLKRAFGVKDSGKLLPGHGGVIDRFDSSLLAVLVYQQLLSKS